MRLTPDTRDFKFLKILQVFEIFCRAPKKKFSKCPEINSVQKIFLENFLSPSKDDLQNVVFAWT